MAAIKLKENFLLLLHPRTNKEVIVFDKENEKIILKLDVQKMLKQYSLNFDHLGNYFTSMFTLTRTLEGQLMLKIYSIHPHLFDVAEFEADDVKQDYADYEYAKTIDPAGLFTTYSLKDNKPNFVCVLWGVNAVNDTLIQSFSKLQIPVTLVEATLEETQDIQCMKFLSSLHFPDLDAYYEKRRADYGIKIIDIDFAGDLLEAKQTIHIVDNRLIDYRLIDVPHFKNTTGDRIALHYGFYGEKFIVGPLIVNEASYGYDSFKQVFQSPVSLPTTPQSLIVAGLVNRTLYYIMKNTLKYLADDAQLPINQVFAFDNYSFTSEIIDLEVE
ncbi:hypothetical protein J9303_01560 [Bacillaceae bacterium Marseille-Q3522]|nr:hypothetical protein [Bacillaceae bacterium Marseille-Q3522]